MAFVVDMVAPAEHKYIALTNAILRSFYLICIIEGGLESGGKDNAKQTNECLLRAFR